MSGIRDEAPLGGVLMGGRSRRFGSDKAAAPLGGRTMAEWAIRSARAACGEPVVLLGGSETTASHLGQPWRPDARADAGPLAGVVVGLEWSEELDRDGLLVLACDLPLVSPALLDAILAARGSGVDAVVPKQRAAPGLQPLCAWYAATALPHARACLQTGERSMLELIARMEVQHVEVERACDDSEVQLLNVNTSEQLALAERLLADRYGGHSMKQASR